MVADIHHHLQKSLRQTIKVCQPIVSHHSVSNNFQCNANSNFLAHISRDIEKSRTPNINYLEFVSEDCNKHTAELNIFVYNIDIYGNHLLKQNYESIQ